MKNKCSLLWSSALFLGMGSVSAQDIHFTQHAEVPLLINPAQTGFYDGFYRGIINYRGQWGAMGKAYSTFMGSFDMPLEMKKKKGGFLGVGGYLYSDRAGDARMGTTEFKGSVSSILPMSSGARISVGFMAGLGQHKWDLAGIQWPNQYNGQTYDPNISPNETLDRSFSYFEIGAGGNYQMRTEVGTLDGKNISQLDAGLAFFHVNGPLQKYSSKSNEHLYRRMVLHARYRKDLPGTKVGLVPSCLIMFQGPARQFHMGVLARYKVRQGTKVTSFYDESALSAGLSLRWNDAISPQFYYEMSDFAIGISYDINISSYTRDLRKTSAFEISLKYANMKGAAYKGTKFDNKGSTQ